MPKTKVQKTQETTSKSSQSKPKRESKENASEGMSKADVFDSAKAVGRVGPGKYEAVIKDLVLQKPDEKGQSARATFAIASEGKFQGDTVAQWYKMFEPEDAQGDCAPAKGLEYLKKDLAILGYPDVRFKELEGVFEEISEKHLGVNVTVKHNDNFVNVYIAGLCEDSEVIEAFLDTNPF